MTVDSVRQTAVSSMTAFMQQYTGGTASVASALTSLASPMASPMAASSAKSTSPGAVVAVSQTEQFPGERHCHSCNWPMGKDAGKGECRGMYWSKCPNAGDKAAMERAKVREAEFKEWKEKHEHKRDKKKKSFKS